MKLSLIVIVFVLASLLSASFAHADEDWGIKVKTLPPAPNPTPNDMTALHLVLANFTVQCPTGYITPLVYNETTFKLTFNVAVIREPFPIPDLAFNSEFCPNRTVIQEYAAINITIPTTIANPAQNIGIYVDGNHNGYILTSEQGKWILSFELPLGTHTITVNLDPYQYPVEVIPEFSVPLLIVLVMMTTILVSVLKLRKKKE